MASKKYMIQPLTPPRQRKASSALSVLSKYTNSTGRSSEAKREGSVPSLPFSLPSYSASYDLSSEFHEHARARKHNGKQTEGHNSLEADLQFYREYCHKEQEISQSLDHLNMAEEEDDEEEEEPDTTEASEPTPDIVDFASWRRDMNSKLATKRRQIRSEKRRARKEADAAANPAPPVPAPTPTPPSPQKHKYTLFTLGKSKKKEEPEPDPLFVSIKGFSKEDKEYPSGLSKHKKSASESIVDPRLFRTVRTPFSIEEEETLSKSKSMSPRRSSPTPSAKNSPRQSSPAKLSPRRISPSKSSPRRGSPAKISPRGCSSAQVSPRGVPSRDSWCASSEQLPLGGVNSTKDMYNSNSNNNYNNNNNNSNNNNNNQNGKRVARNAVSVAIAT